MNTALRDALQRTLGTGFRIDRELGGGGMSRVFLATDLTLDRQVVVKVLSHEMSAGVSADRFRREIQLVAKLQHPHVVPLLAAGDAEGALYYVMPYISGEPLRARMAREGPMKVGDVVRILRETLDALAFAHSHGVIHRDMKPDNILIGAGHAVVADFGVSKALQDSSASGGALTSVGIALGTPAYMAPEQAAADPNTDHRADLYAVAVVAYEMLTGAPPFAGTPSQLLKAHLADTPTPIKQRRSDIPDALADVIMRALEKDADQRPQSAAEMVAVLDAVSTPGGTQAQPAVTPTASVAAAPAKPKSKFVWVAAAATVIVAVAAVLYAKKSPVIASAQSLAITPFSVADGDTALVRLGQNLVTTMSANLDGVGELRVADAMSVLSHAKASGALLSVQQAVDIAKKLGARSAVYGTLARAGTMVRADLSLYDVSAPQTPTARLSASLPLDSVSALTDSLTWGLLREIWAKGKAPTPNASSITTHSPVALREFLEGERMFARGGITEATAAYERAVAADTSFWFAHYRYRIARGWFALPVDTTISRRLARHVRDLPERERLLILATDSSTSQTERLQKLEALIAKFPDYGPAILNYGDYLIHHAVRSGHEVKEAIAPFRRLTELMPTDMESASHLVWAYATSGDVAGARVAYAHFDSLVRSDPKPLAVPRSQQGWLGFALYPSNPARLDSLDRESQRDSMPRVMPGPFALFLASSFADRPEILREYDDLSKRFASRLPPAQRQGWQQSINIARMLRGEVSIIDSAMTILASQPPAQAAAGKQFILRLRAQAELQGLLEGAPSTTATALAQVAAPATSPAARVEFRWIAATSALVRGDSAVFKQQLGELSRDTGRVASIAVRSLRGIAMGRAGKTAAAAESLLVLEREHGDKNGKVWGAYAADRLLAAQWLTENKRFEPADSLLRFTEGYTITQTAETALGVLPAAMLQRSRTAEGLGDKTKALRFAQSFLVLYDHPSPQAKALVEEARQRVTRLGGKLDAPRTQTVVP